MPSHTPEPWPEPSINPFDDEGKPIHQSTDKKVIALRPEDYARARVCVNGCAGIDNPAETLRQLRLAAFEALYLKENCVGLNPAAYRQVVEALRPIVECVDEEGKLVGKVPSAAEFRTAKHALALAEQQL